MVVIIDTKGKSVNKRGEAWAGEAMEEIPEIMKDWGSAPRAGVALAVQPGIAYAVSHV